MYGTVVLVCPAALRVLAAWAFWENVYRGLACSGCGNQRHKEYLTLPDVGPELNAQLDTGHVVLCSGCASEEL